MVPSHGESVDPARCAACIFTATPPTAVQPELTGAASAEERPSRSCTRDVTPSIDRFQSGGQLNAPFGWGIIEARTRKEFWGSSVARSFSDCAAEGTEANEISVGARSM